MTLLQTLKRCWWLLLPVLAVALGFGWRTGALKRSGDILANGPPVIEYPAAIDLGDRRANEVVTSRFEIVNRGGQELVVKQIKPHCSCGKLEREIDGRSEEIEELCLLPGEHAGMIVHTAIRTDGAGTYHKTISFLTNDPAQPEGLITLVFRTATGGIRVYPTAVQFSEVPIGRKERQLVDVLDHDRPPQTVTKVLSADPERVAVRWIPVAEIKERRDETSLLGQIEVVPNTAQPILLDTAIRIEFADPKIQSLTIQVNGRVTPRVQTMPQSLVLPLSAGSGPVYTGRCVVRSQDGRAWRLELESVSPGLTVKLPEPPEGMVQVIRITWTPAPGEPSGLVKKTVRLRAKVGEESETFEIPVTCERR